VYLETYYALLAEHHSERAEAMQDYMRNHFVYMGVAAPVRKQVEKSFYKQYGLPEYADLSEIVHDAWATDEREIQYFAMDLVERMHKQWQPDVIILIEMMLTKKAWWDSVDFIASHLAGKYFQRFPNEMYAITTRWNTSDDLWLQRSSIIFQLFYKKNTDTALLFSHIKTHIDSKEFFLQKAIGWALRQHTRINTQIIVDFVAAHENLSALSKKEAMKLFIQ
jgi:3-methyladenine DNA glycosylase AlkD